MAGVARRRLDAELVRRKLARSREHAGQLIAAGRVSVGKTVATKSATQVETAAAIVVAVDGDDPDYVSRGGHKLAGALAAFVPQGLLVEGRRALDSRRVDRRVHRCAAAGGGGARGRRGRRIRTTRVVSAER